MSVDSFLSYSELSVYIILCAFLGFVVIHKLEKNKNKKKHDSILEAFQIRHNINDIIDWFNISGFFLITIIAFFVYIFEFVAVIQDKYYSVESFFTSVLVYIKLLLLFIIPFFMANAKIFFSKYKTLKSIVEFILPFNIYFILSVLCSIFLFGKSIFFNNIIIYSYLVIIIISFYLVFLGSYFNVSFVNSIKKHKLIYFVAIMVFILQLTFFSNMLSVEYNEESSQLRSIFCEGYDCYKDYINIFEIDNGWLDNWVFSYNKNIKIDYNINEKYENIPYEIWFRADDPNKNRDINIPKRSFKDNVYSGENFTIHLFPEKKYFIVKFDDLDFINTYDKIYVRNFVERPGFVPKSYAEIFWVYIQRISGNLTMQRHFDYYTELEDYNLGGSINSNLYNCSLEDYTYNSRPNIDENHYWPGRDLFVCKDNKCKFEGESYQINIKFDKDNQLEYNGVIHPGTPLNLSWKLPLNCQKIKD